MTEDEMVGWYHGFNGREFEHLDVGFNDFLIRPGDPQRKKPTGLPVVLRS